MEKKLKVLMLNGSPRKNGNIALAFHEMEQVFDECGVEYENIQLGRMDIRGCIACESCRRNGKCAFDDIVNELAVKLEAANGLVIGSPVYFGSANGTLMSALQRLFYSCNCDLHMKVGASVVSCRRGGNSGTFQTMNMLFGISGMPTAPSSYWNDVHGFTGEDVYKDVEGMRTIRNLANNMAFMIKAIDAKRDEIPAVERGEMFNFVR